MLYAKVVPISEWVESACFYKISKVTLLSSLKKILFLRLDNICSFTLWTRFIRVLEYKTVSLCVLKDTETRWSHSLTTGETDFFEPQTNKSYTCNSALTQTNNTNEKFSQTWSKSIRYVLLNVHVQFKGSQPYLLFLELRGKHLKETYSPLMVLLVSTSLLNCLWNPLWIQAYCSIQLSILW